MRSFHTRWLLAGAWTLAMIALAPEPAAGQQAPDTGLGGPPPNGLGRGGFGRGRGPRTPAGPTPRLPENPLLGVNSGKPDFGGKGMWQVPYIIDMQKQGKTVEGGVIEVPFNAAAKKIFDQRTETNSKDDPEGFCLPPGVPRMMYTPYPTQIYQLADRILFIYEGGAHVWRLIWMDGRNHPVDPNPTFLGDAIGRWEGDTLLVDTVGFNDRTWLDAAGHPHGEKLHVVERYTRTDSNTLRVAATIDDPDYYTKPWTVVTTATWAPGQELLEYICQENNRDTQHLVGK
ncbi:MAG TPA: hypothetical protein VLY24_05525 [Bryobacteraceae bacterium]|nr:hypothetical protein [Bryobacteraceae bacterium]